MILNIIITLFFLAIASVEDFKKKTVSSYTIMPFLVIGMIATLLFMATYPHVLFRYFTLILACAWGIVGYVLREKNLLGGADILLIAGIILMTPQELFYPEFYMLFGLITCVTGLIYYGIVKFSSPQLISDEKIKSIKFVPCIIIGYVLACYSILGVALL